MKEHIYSFLKYLLILRESEHVSVWSTLLLLIDVGNLRLRYEFTFFFFFALKYLSDRVNAD